MDCVADASEKNAASIFKSEVVGWEYGVSHSSVWFSLGGEGNDSDWFAREENDSDWLAREENDSDWFASMEQCMVDVSNTVIVRAPG